MSRSFLIFAKWFSSNSIPRGMSRKNKPKCCNPIFEQWIKEWREDAVARDLSSKHTYSKVA